MQKYRVIGPCAVAGVAPGGVVTRDDLDKAGAIIEPLLGVHLEAQADDSRLKKPAPKEVRDAG